MGRPSARTSLMPDLAGKKTAYYGFTGIIEPGSATRIASAFNIAVNNGYDEIYLCFSSTGGYVADGIYLYNHITSLPIKTTIHNTGTVASIATAVYVASSDRTWNIYDADRNAAPEHGRNTRILDRRWRTISAPKTSPSARPLEILSLPDDSERFILLRRRRSNSVSLRRFHAPKGERNSVAPLHLARSSPDAIAKSCRRPAQQAPICIA